jgi:hypothetical protein
MNAYTVARSAAAVGAAQRPHAMHEAQAVEDMCSVVVRTSNISAMLLGMSSGTAASSSA